MSVPNQTPYIIYNANGLTTVFPFEFYIISASDIQVSFNGVPVTSGYTVSGVGNVSGGNLTFLTPPASGTVVMLERVVPTYRLTDYQDNGDLLASTVNKDFDRLWMAIQRYGIHLGLALRRPLFGGPFDAEGYRIADIAYPINPSDSANKKYVDDINNYLMQTVQTALDTIKNGLYGYNTKRSFEEGNTLSYPNDVLLWEVEGEYYRWDGKLPKDVPPGSTPESTGGVAPGAWRSVGDSTLRGNLASDTGAEIIGTNSGLTVQEKFDELENITVALGNKLEPTVITVVQGATDNPIATPPIYGTLSAAMASITDNGPDKPYRIEMYAGVYDAREILLKDYVDIVRSPMTSSTVFIEHSFSSTEPYRKRDIFKTSNTPYDATDSFPIRCKLDGLYIRATNANYCLHIDFNDHPQLDIQINNCLMINTESGVTDPCDYALGIGIYGGQRIVANNSQFYGRYSATETNPVRRQGSGWIVHNRADQTRPCRVEFNNCKSLRGFYGGRVVDYGSGQEDVVAINGGVLIGEFANLLCIDNGPAGAITPSITVTGSVPIRRIQLAQQVLSGAIYKCGFPISIEGFSCMFIAGEALDDGDLVLENAYGTRVSKTPLSSFPYRPVGVVLNKVASGGRVTVQTSGIAAVKYDLAAGEIATSAPITNAKTAGANGKVVAASTGSNVIGAAIASTPFTTTVTPGRAWVYLDYSGVKS
ncbi:phage tail fiber domain-containing protein [Citrobacter amalonaticus]